MKPFGWLVLFSLAGCGGGASPILSSAEMETLKRLGPLPAVPASPTNHVADDPNAQALGQSLFFEKGMSADGTIGCVSCHDPAHGLSDPKPVSVGVGGKQGTRHAMALVNLAFNSFNFWDGRVDSIWAQPIQAIENPNEAAFSRCGVAHFMAGADKTAYEGVFGPLPDLSAIPASCLPGDGVWETLSADQQLAINRIASNVGKALEAYLRTLVSKDSKLDKYLAGDTSALNDSELRGAKFFVSTTRGNCAICHDGPNLTDNSFHVLGVPEPVGTLDNGRFDGMVKLLLDPFNGDGAFSDSPGGRLAGLAPRPPMKGQFKTPSLRDVTLRGPFGHTGSFATLEDFINFHDQGSGDPTQDNYVGTKELLLVPIHMTAAEKTDLMAFLKALEGAPRSN